MYNYIPLEQAADILDSYRKPVNSKERLNLIKGKPLDELFPYYGATGQVGWIDSFLTDGEYILLGEDGAPFLNPYAEKAYIVHGKTWVNNHAHILHSKTNNEFLCYYLNYFNYKKYVSGTTRLKLTQAQMRKIPIPNIPSDEQSRIVAHIKELFSELDKAVDTLKTTKEQLEVYRQVVLKDEFSRVSQYAPLGNVATSRLGKMLDKQKNTGTPKKYLRNINVRWFSFDLADLQEMKIEETEFEKYTIKKDDLVICEGGEPGRCAVWEKNETIYFQKALHRVRFTVESEPRLYMYYIWFMTNTGALNKFYTGTGIKHLTGQSLEKVLVPVIDIKIQQKLLASIELRLSVCDSVEKIVDTALAQAGAMRQNILKQAFEGKI